MPGWPSLDALALKDVHREGLLAFYVRHGFRTWRKELEDALAAGGRRARRQRRRACCADARRAELQATLADAHATALPPARCYDTVLGPAALAAWLEKIAAAPLTAIDTETDSLDAMRARLVGISLSVAPGEAAYIPLRHDYAGAPAQLPADEVLASLRPWLEDAREPKLGQNIKYDTHVFANAGIAVRGYVHDTMLESYVLEAHKPHGLESLAARHLGRSGLSYEDLCGKGAHQIPFAQVDIAKAAEYSGEDSEMCLHVHRTLWPRIEARAWPALRLRAARDADCRPCSRASSATAC